jgi:predicted amidohydrolase
MFDIGILQMDVTDRKDFNLIKAEHMIQEASQRAQIILLPEMFNCPYDIECFYEYSELEGGLTYEFLSRMSKSYKVAIIGGSIPERVEEEGQTKIYNTSYIFDQTGTCVGKHRKIHLFDIDIEGQIKFIESDVLDSGSEVTIVDLGFVTIGVCICYDIRFPELIRSMVLKGADLIMVPAAFNTVTGPAHWHITSRCRAVDNQCYVAMASPARSKELSYKAYGHSLVSSPWGSILSEADESESIIYATIEKQKIAQIRRELPLLKHMKPEVYQ